jgi:hypothetical protein
VVGFGDQLVEERNCFSNPGQKEALALLGQEGPEEALDSLWHSSQIGFGMKGSISKQQLEEFFPTGGSNIFDEKAGTLSGIGR